MDVVVVVTKGERELVDASYSEGKKVEKWVSLAWRHRVRGRFRCAGCAVDRAGATAVHTFWARGPVFFFFFLLFVSRNSMGWLLAGRGGLAEYCYRCFVLFYPPRPPLTRRNNLKLCLFFMTRLASFFRLVWMLYTG